jgi:transcriptional regulator with XRE-family HTH domain
VNAALVSNRESTADTERTTMSKFESTGESPPDAMASDQAHASPSLPEIELGALAARLKLLIGDHSVAFFARKCGMAESVLRTYLNDRRMPSLNKAWAIAAAGGVTLDWLATGRGRRVTAPVGAAYATNEHRSPMPARFRPDEVQRAMDRDPFGRDPWHEGGCREIAPAGLGRVPSRTPQRMLTVRAFHAGA